MDILHTPTLQPVNYARKVKQTLCIYHLLLPASPNHQTKLYLVHSKMNIANSMSNLPEATPDRQSTQLRLEECLQILFKSRLYQKMNHKFILVSFSFNRVMFWNAELRSSLLQMASKTPVKESLFWQIAVERYLNVLKMAPSRQFSCQF